MLEESRDNLTVRKYMTEQHGGNCYLSHITEERQSYCEKVYD